MYDIPLFVKPGILDGEWELDEEMEEVKICPVVDRLDEVVAKMVESGMRDCPEAQNGGHASQTLCPFGFWGYRYPIEQLSSTDRLVTEIAVQGNSRFEMVAALAQYKVDKKALNNHLESLEKPLKSKNLKGSSHVNSKVLDLYVLNARCTGKKL